VTITRYSLYQMKKKSKIEKYTDQEALDYHNSGKSGKIEINSSKPMSTQRDLALAYSPGVAAPVKAIADNPDAAYDYTTKGNLVAVISNGSAILGLGNLGALASKPVMEGKAVLFKRFADINAIDLEIDSSDPNEIINCIKTLGKSFGGIKIEEPILFARGSTLFLSASTWYVKAISAPSEAIFLAMPQEIDRSLATPIINPFFPFMIILLLFI